MIGKMITSTRELNGDRNLSLHVAIIICIPGLTGEGKKTSQVTEMADVFPTLVEAARLPLLKNSSIVSFC